MIASLIVLFALMTVDGPIPWSTSRPISLDIKAGTRASLGAEAATFDSRWLLGAEAEKVAFKIDVNGTELCQTNGCGEVVWSSRRPGAYAFACQMYEDVVFFDDSLLAAFAVTAHLA